MQIKKYIFSFLLLIIITFFPTSTNALDCAVWVNPAPVNFGGILLYGYDYMVVQELTFSDGDYIRINVIADDGGCVSPQSIYIHYLSLLAVILLSALIYMYYRTRRNLRREKLLYKDKNAN